MKVNQVVNIQIAERKEKLVNHTLCTVLGTGLYTLGGLLCVGVGMMVPDIALAVYSGMV